jgi:hypothetical protein
MSETIAMRKKLWLVNIDMDLFVVADSRREAERLGRKHASEEASNGVFHIRARPPCSVSSDWMETIPYGGEDDKTVREYLDEQKDLR